jgi:2,4-dienoyl-CoA reductase-like NADH-dependent reductase (Old Yellow Enzyme family)
LRWQGSAEAIVPEVFFREGLNNRKDEYGEQFERRTEKAEAYG